MFIRSSPYGSRPTNRAWATGWPASSQAVLLPRQPRTRDISRASMVHQLTWGCLSSYAVSSYDWPSCHYAVTMWWLVFRRSFLMGVKILQCLVQFIRMWHREPGWSLLVLKLCLVPCTVCDWISPSISASISRCFPYSFTEQAFWQPLWARWGRITFLLSNQICVYSFTLRWTQKSDVTRENHPVDVFLCDYWLPGEEIPHSLCWLFDSYHLLLALLGSCMWSIKPFISDDLFSELKRLF